MNRILAISMIVVVCTFMVSYFWVSGMQNQQDHTPLAKTTNVESNQTTSTSDPPVELLDADSAKELLLKSIREKSSEYRMLSRARIRRESRIETVYIQNTTEPNAPYFLGTMTISKNAENSTVAFAIDRVTQSIYIFANSQWHNQKDWILY